MAKGNHSASGSAAGYTFQFERALNSLVTSAAGDVIGIETLDDVAIIRADGSQQLEQDKHITGRKPQPFGDRSENLWKTLAIWLNFLDNKHTILGKTTFLMVTNSKVPECIAREIADAEKEEQITQCIKNLELAANNPPKEVADYMHQVLKPESRANLKYLIQHCSLSDSSDGTNAEQLRKQSIDRLAIPKGFIAESESIATELFGWLVTSIMQMWEQKKPAWIERNNFINQFYWIIDRRKREIRRERAVHLIPVSKDSIVKEKGSCFVKQIYLVADDDDIVENAICEFIRCNIEKSRLSQEGDYTDDDWVDFETRCYSRWSKISSHLKRSLEDEPAENVGFEIFSETTRDHKEKLAGVETEQVYLTAGTYHRLADTIRVGWHPNFEFLMREGEDIG